MSNGLNWRCQECDAIYPSAVTHCATCSAGGRRRRDTNTRPASAAPKTIAEIAAIERDEALAALSAANDERDTATETLAAYIESMSIGLPAVADALVNCETELASMRAERDTIELMRAELCEREMFLIDQLEARTAECNRLKATAELAKLKIEEERIPKDKTEQLLLATRRNYDRAMYACKQEIERRQRAEKSLANARDEIDVLQKHARAQQTQAPHTREIEDDADLMDVLARLTDGNS